MKSRYYIIIIVVLLFFAEIFSRNLAPKLNEADDLLGWKLIKNLDLKFSQKSLLGNKYLVNFKTNNRGARSFGDEINSEIKTMQ